MKKFAPWVLSLLLTAACIDQTAPQGVMDEATMTDFLTEAYLLEGYYAIECGYEFDEKKPQIAKSYDHLLAKYGLSKGDFEKSIAYYLEHEDVYARILDNVTRQIDAEADSAGAIIQ